MIAFHRDVLVQLLSSETRIPKLIERYFRDMSLIDQLNQTYGSQFLNRLCQFVGYTIYQPGDCIIEAGKNVDKLYFLMGGRICKYTSIKQSILDEPQIHEAFAEICFLTEQVSKEYYTAVEETLVCHVTKEQFLQIIRKNTVTMSLITELLRFPFFSELSLKFLELIIQKGNLQQYARHQLIYDIDEEALNWYIIKRGQFKMFQQYEQKFHPLLVLGPGDYFGEVELLRQCRRQYRIECDSLDNQVLEIPKSIFNWFLMKSPDFESKINKIANSKYISNQGQAQQNEETLGIPFPLPKPKPLFSITTNYPTIRKVHASQALTRKDLLEDKNSELKQLLESRSVHIVKELQASKERRLKENPRLAQFLNKLKKLREQQAIPTKNHSIQDSTNPKHRKVRTQIPYLDTQKQIYNLNLAECKNSYSTKYNSTSHHTLHSPLTSSRYLKILFPDKYS